MEGQIMKEQCRTMRTSSPSLPNVSVGSTSIRCVPSGPLTLIIISKLIYRGGKYLGVGA